MIVLGIETSCDETAVAVSKDYTILHSEVSTQTIHREFGGVVPEIASREHEKLLNFMVDHTLNKLKIAKSEIEGIAVTQGPGLAGTLITGTSFAKGLAQGLNCKIIAINHLEAHIFANFLADPKLEYPFVCLLVSGGHTQIWLVKGLKEYNLMGETRDDAAGEAFDKGARILGLGYPGGPEIEKLSKTYGEARVFNQLMQGSIWNRPEDWMSSIERKERAYMAQWLEEDKLNLPNNLNSISLSVYAYDDHNGQLVLEHYFNNSTAADEEIAALEDDAL